MSARIPALAIALAAVVSTGADWPQWLGPNRNAVSSEIVAPWSTPPVVHWRLPVGEGNGGPNMTVQGAGVDCRRGRYDQAIRDLERVIRGQGFTVPPPPS